MAITLYKFPDPELEVTLEDGGNLAPNTTYYLAGCYLNSFGMFSKATPQVTITTTSTQKSIRVKIKYWNGSEWKYNAPYYGGYIPFGSIVIEGIPVINIVDSVYIAIDTNDLTSGGDYYYHYYYDNMKVINAGKISLSNWSYLITSYPSTNNLSYFIPKLYYGYPFGFSFPGEFKLQSYLPLIWCDTNFASSSILKDIKDYLDNNYPEIKSIVDTTSYTFYLGMHNLYFDNSSSFLDKTTIYLYNANLFAKATINLTNIILYSAMYSRSVYAGKMVDCQVKPHIYRPNIMCYNADSKNINISTVGNQFSFTPTQIQRTFTKTYLLSNGIPNSANQTLINCLLNLQIVTGTEITTKLYWYNNRTECLQLWSNYDFELTVLNSFNKNPATFIFNDFEFILLNRPPSEGIDYVTEKKPRIYWSGANDYGRNDVTLKFKYLINIKVVDKNNNPLQANITASNDFETVSTQTDVNGNCNFTIQSRMAQADNSRGIPTYYTIWTDRETTIQISKSGYKTYTYQALFNEPTDLTVVLEKETLVVSSLSFTHPSSVNNDGTITIDASGGSPPYYYSINDGESYESTNQFSNLSAGTYYIKVKDSEDSSTNSYEVKLTNTEYILYDPVYGNIEQTKISCNIDPTVIYGNIEQTEISGNVSDSIIYGNAEIDTVVINS